MNKTKAVAMTTKELKFCLVFSQRRAMRLKHLSLPIACSMRGRPGKSALPKILEMFFVVDR